MYLRVIVLFLYRYVDQKNNRETIDSDVIYRKLRKVSVNLLFLVLINPIPALWKFQLSFRLSFMNCFFKSPFPHGISNNLLWGGYTSFWEQQNKVKFTSNKDMKRIQTVGNIPLPVPVISCWANSMTKTWPV